MDTELLKEIGLTEGEAKVYIALFKLGSTSTGPLIKEAKIHASKVYPILDRLIDKGLVSFVKEGKKTIYSANPATTIVSYLEKLQQKIQQQTASAGQLIQELEMLKKFQKMETEVTVFRGLNGIKTAFTSATANLELSQDVYAMFLPAVHESLLPFFKELVTTLVQKYKVHHHLLFNEYCPEVDMLKGFPNVELRVGVSLANKSPAEVCVFGNNTLIATTAGKEFIAVLIRDRAIADSFKHQFERIWAQQVNTYMGEEGVKAVFNDILNYTECRFIGGNWGIIKYYPYFFEQWNKYREEKKIKWLDLVDAEFLIRKQQEPVALQYYQAKVLSEQVSSPAVILIYGSKVVNILWAKESIFNVIDNKDIANHYTKYFDYLWGQDVMVSHGLKALMNAHEKTYQLLKKGEEYIYLGVPSYQPAEQHQYWKTDHERRVKAGLKCRILFNKDTNQKILENRNSYPGCDARYMPSDIKTPSYLGMFKDTVVISIPQENPIVIEINNKEVAASFKAYFEAFWKKSMPFQ